MSKVDITLAIIILVGAYGGFREGFIMEVFSFLAIVLGVLGGFKLMGWAMIMLEREFHVDSQTLPYIAFATVFVIIVFAVNLLSRFVRPKADKSFLGKADQVAGALLGFFKTTFMVSILLWIYHSLKFEFPEHWTSGSWILPMVAELAPKIIHKMGVFVPIFKGVF